MALKTEQVEQGNRLDRRRPASSSYRLDHPKTKQAKQAEQAGEARQAKQAEQAKQGADEL